MGILRRLCMISRENREFTGAIEYIGKRFSVRFNVIGKSVLQTAFAVVLMIDDLCFK